MNLSSFQKYIFVFSVFILLIASGCKKTEDEVTAVIPPKGDPVKPETQPSKLNINDIAVFLNSNGDISTNESANFFKAGNSAIYLSSAGLWLGINTGGALPEINSVAATNMTPIPSNYTSKWNGVDMGVYRVNAEILKSSSFDELRSYGYPFDAQGNPKLYGDEMLWSAQHGDTIKTVPLYTNPVRNIRTAVSLFAYKRADLKNVLFIRYDLTNTGTTDLQEVYTAFRTDTDVADALNNSTGYDKSRGITYTYIKPGKYLSGSDSTYKLVSGFTFLKSPLADQTVPFGISSHRISRKNNYYDPDFGETGVGLNEIFNALKGLSNSGKQMADPATNLPTMFAFTGDPVAGTGWLDTSVDTRNMICAGPFSLKASETKTLIVLWINTGETSLSESLNKLKSQTDLIRSDRSLWDL